MKQGYKDVLFLMLSILVTVNLALGSAFFWKWAMS